MMQQEPTIPLAALWEKFKGTIMARVDVLDRAAAALLSGSLSEDLRLGAEREAHKLAGSVGSFGFSEGSRLSGELELMFKAGPLPERSNAVRLAELVGQLRRELDRSPGSPLPPETAAPPKPEGPLKR